MGKIQILDNLIANQIAAGEVIERPASVVKELVENAIDAEASKINVHIEEGGITAIRVSDNGLGMDAEDAILAFSRHATSKIKSNRDLFSIRSLGFRGEALPSVASVAKVTMITSQNAGMAMHVEMEGGELKEEKASSRSRGTDIIVENLFFNTPARLKYLKTVNTEVSHVADVVGRVALAYPHISFSLKHNRRELFRTLGDGKLAHVIHSLYGRHVVQQSLFIDTTNEDFRLHGVITKPEVTRASRSYITWILNGRYVRSLPLTQTLLRAYGTLLPVSRFPIAAIAIDMDPKLIDVNVHPAKLEVRLSKEKECCQLITQACKEVFQQSTLIPKVVKKQMENRAEQQSITWEKRENWLVKDPALTTVEKDDDSMLAKTDKAIVGKSPPQLDEEKRSVVPSKRATFDQEQGLGELGHSVNESKHDVDIPIKEENEQSSIFPSLTPLTQVHGTYVVAQSEDGFYLLDQHAAHERIYYETFHRNLGQPRQQQQMLLIPLSIETTPAEAVILQRHINDFQAWGLDMEHFGGTTFLVRAHPTWFPSEGTESLLAEMITWFQERGQVNLSEFRDASAKMMSCKAAIKANRHLRQDEMYALLDKLARCEQPFTCPHGRPILIHFSKYEIEKMFKRVM